ncbi:AAA family ATPase [Geoglobus sp.]
MPDEAKKLVGFSGPSGSGKTTLVNRLAEKLECGKVTEVATEVFRKWGGETRIQKSG